MLIGNHIRIFLVCLLLACPCVASESRPTSVAVASAFTGVITSAEVVAASPRAKNISSSTSGFFIKGAVVVQRILAKRPSDGLEVNRKAQVCTDQHLAVGSTYLFIVGSVPVADRSCLPVVSFITESMPGNTDRQGIVLTDDNVRLVAAATNVSQKATAVPDLNIAKGYCPRKIVILKSLVDIDEFVKTMERTAPADNKQDKGT